MIKRDAETSNSNRCIQCKLRAWVNIDTISTNICTYHEVGPRGCHFPCSHKKGGSLMVKGNSLGGWLGYDVWCSPQSRVQSQIPSGIEDNENTVSWWPQACNFLKHIYTQYLMLHIQLCTSHLSSLSSSLCLHTHGVPCSCGEWQVLALNRSLSKRKISD